MPCYDGGPSYPERPRTYNGLTGEQLEAALCGLMTVLEEASGVGGTPLAANQIADALGRVDWREAGISRKQVTDWWKAHKAADKARRDREERARLERERKEKLKQSALSKLTPAERIALGL